MLDSAVRLMTAQRRNPFMKSFTTPLACPATSSDGGVIPSLLTKKVPSSFHLAE